MTQLPEPSELFHYLYRDPTAAGISATMAGMIPIGTIDRSHYRELNSWAETLGHKLQLASEVLNER